MTHTVEMYEPDGDVDNDDRALMVAPLVAAFASAYYWGSEIVEDVVKDLIADLGHYLDRATDDSLPAHIFRDVDAPWADRTAGFNHLVTHALGDYEYEVAEERQDQEATT